MSGPPGPPRSSTTDPTDAVLPAHSEKRFERERGTDDEHTCRDVDQAKVAQRIEMVRVVRGKCDGERENWGADRRHVGPHLAPAHAEPAQRCGRQTSGRDKPRDRDVQMGDVVIEIGAEGLDLGPGRRYLVRADAELEKGVGEVAGEEDGRVPDECQARGGHESGTEAEPAGCGRRLRAGDRGHVVPPYPAMDLPAS